MSDSDHYTCLSCSDHFLNVCLVQIIICMFVWFRSLCVFASFRLIFVRVSDSDSYVCLPRTDQSKFTWYRSLCAFAFFRSLLVCLPRSDHYSYVGPIQIISGTQIPKPKDSKKGEVIDPFIKIEVHGAPNDNSEYRSKVIKNNGEIQIIDRRV